MRACKFWSGWKRGLVFLLVFAVCLGMTSASFAADFDGVSPLLPLPETMPELPFSDVHAEDWFFPFVESVYALSLMDGVSETEFAPSGTVSVAQGLVVSVRLFERYHQLPPTEIAEGADWYRPFIESAEAFGILPEALDLSDPNRPALRCELAEILGRCLPSDVLPPLNDTVIPWDYADSSAPYFEKVVLLYRAGILTGRDKYGTFCPDAPISRAELATVLSRMILPELRVEPSESKEPPKTGMEAFTLPEVLPEMPFVDVTHGHWFYDQARKSYALGLMNGVSETEFDGSGTVSIGQVLTVSVRVYERYHGIEDASAGYPGEWYQYGLDRSWNYGILPPDGLELSDPNRPARRNEVAGILGHSLPVEELSPINSVDTLPDYSDAYPFYEEIMALYNAGILTGSDQYGSFHASENIQRGELAALLTRLVLPEERKSFTLEPLPEPEPEIYMEEICYGQSGAGRDLMAYRYGDGDNVAVLCFGIHGWEDNFDQDGILLYETAEGLKRILENEYEDLIQDRDWSVYVLPSLNPDGLWDGWTCNGPGRCTTYYYDDYGNLVNDGYYGIDMNRCFPYNFRARYDSRNYVGSEPLGAIEARYLAQFVLDVMGPGKNYLVDTHGWYRQIIVDVQDGRLSNAFHEYFRADYDSLYGASGYFSSWAAYVAGYDEACLFEFPAVYSSDQFWGNDYHGAYYNAIRMLLRGNPKQ